MQPMLSPMVRLGVRRFRAVSRATIPRERAGLEPQLAAVLGNPQPHLPGHGIPLGHPVGEGLQLVDVGLEQGGDEPHRYAGVGELIGRPGEALKRSVGAANPVVGPGEAIQAQVHRADPSGPREPGLEAAEALPVGHQLHDHAGPGQGLGELRPVGPQQGLASREGHGPAAEPSQGRGHGEGFVGVELPPPRPAGTAVAVSAAQVAGAGQLPLHSVGEPVLHGRLLWSTNLLIIRGDGAVVLYQVCNGCRELPRGAISIQCGISSLQ